MLGYGMGTNGAGGAGVLHTSGKAMLMPLEALWTTVRKLTLTVAGMSGSSSQQ